MPVPHVNLHYLIAPRLSSSSSAGTDLCFRSPQLDNSLSCEIRDMGLGHYKVCLYMSQLLLALIVPTHEGTASMS